MFAKKGIVIDESIDAQKTPIGDEAAWNLLKEAEEIVVGRGNAYRSFTPSPTGKGDILEICIGRTGNLRAPALRIGNRFIIGFNSDMYARYLGS